MKNSEKNPNPSMEVKPVKVFVRVPSKFLETFDHATHAWFATRSEAIRRGMTLVLMEINQ